MTIAGITKLIDLTTLQPTDGRETAKYIAEKAIRYMGQGIHPATVCVYPTLVKQVKAEVKGAVPIASVAGGFPSGQTSVHIKVNETRYALEQGADEIDLVINRAMLIEGEDNYVFEEISSVKTVCGNKKLKVIIETGELQTEVLIKKAADICIRAGADFVKTSTGKIPIGATPDAARWIAEVVKEHNTHSPKQVGIKLSGGIATIADANAYIDLISSYMGDTFIQPKFFRIGASRLYDELLAGIGNH